MSQGAPLSVGKIAGLLLALAILAIGGYLKLNASAIPDAAPASPAPPIGASQPSKRVDPARPHSVSSPPAPKAPGSDAAELRVGSWNIEWLGKPSERSGAGKDVAQNPADLADCIVSSRVAVLGVCEIVSNISGRPIRSREIESTIDAIGKKTGDTWEYVLFPGRNEGDQLTGVLWNTAVVTPETAADAPWNRAKDAPWALPIPKGRSDQGSALWNRPPHAMKFSAGKGKTDFVIVVLHMKADYNGDFARHRKQEADALVLVLPALRKQFHDDDIILLGDTNCTGDHEPAIVSLENAGYVDLNVAHRATHWRGGSMDRALVPLGQPEFAAHTFEIISDSYMAKRGIDPREYKRRYSDHFMIVGSLKVMPDDD